LQRHQNPNIKGNNRDGIPRIDRLSKAKQVETTEIGLGATMRSGSGLFFLTE